VNAIHQHVRRKTSSLKDKKSYKSSKTYKEKYIMKNLPRIMLVMLLQEQFIQDEDLKFHRHIQFTSH
jgi:hypothetical protein